MKKYYILLIMVCAIFGAFFFAPAPASAACPTGQTWDDSSQQCVAFNSCANNNEFKSFIKPGTCLSSYEAWIDEVWGWTMRILIPLSVLILTGAGVIYMTSEGDSNRIGIAKKMIFGVLSGIGILILGRLILVVILGDAGAGGWIF